MVEVIIHYLIMALIFSSGGAIEAVLWSRKGADAFKWNEHILLAVNRGLIFVAAYVAVSPWILASSLLAFPFFQAGTYYTFRHLIDNNVYPDGWWSQPSNTSTATVNVSTQLRTLAMISSLALLAFYITIL